MNQRAGKLESRLGDLRDHIEWPDSRDFSASVRRRIEDGARPRYPRWRFLPRTAVVVAIVAVALIAASLAFPGARRAVADWLGISGIQIRVGEEAPKPEATSGTLADLGLGDEVSLEEAQARVEFDIREPSGFDLGEPRVFIRPLPVGGAVSLVYQPSPDLPKTKETGVGLLITQFEGRLNPDLVKKEVGVTSTVQPVDIGDGGYWLEGAPHTIMFLDAHGQIQEDTIRLAGNTLVWEEDAVSYRLESSLDLDEALKLARSME